VRHGGSLDDRGRRKHGEGVGPIHHGAEGVRGHRGGRRGRRGGAAFTSPVVGLRVGHLGGKREEEGRSEL